VILGRLHLHEGAYADFHPDLPRPMSPWNRDFRPDGSSTGSGTAVAAGLCFGALGTDTGGSIRYPSAANGVTGVKTTWGRTSRHGGLPLSALLDTIGPRCRSAADAAALLGAIAGSAPRVPTALRAPVPDYPAAFAGIDGARHLRLGIDARLLDEVEPEMAAAIQMVVRVFADLGADLRPIDLPERMMAVEAALLIIDTECARFHRQAFDEDAEAFGPFLADAIRRGTANDAVALAGAYVK
jgi:amidase